ncbi:tRNA 2-selenouridine(34) synthase MnmH [Limnohabitans sp. T6-5]|uniref:tRNA 2-selenouridine(34) synthase MnmH n=1 Tax=Limnohabitans sp. T6-5 TaxID=1100724 RepID=UPI000D34C19E|nr:tRNA 2-selenouridine(34) synthase MnmH [Limnohabitans sp. T6-5]PUE08797.1 tRNA 2-selenouridine(34) synthase MnmH [Limnohabitans sp. T6-5]
MSVHLISAAQAMARLDQFDAILDARSEGEHAEDHLPGALSWPSLNNEERIKVGTLYKQVNPFEAQKVGAALVAKNIARHIETHLMDKPKSWQPLIYCWRGGKRSNSLALILGQIGFKVHLIEGGYKAFRKEVMEDTPRQAQRLHFQVLCGPTGSGKTRLLQALASQGAQVLDLEAIAVHRSSVLGLIPGQPQPTQKAFDTQIWDALRSFSPDRPVYVEAESKKVGNLSVPAELMVAMRASPCLRVELSLQDRVSLLMEDYAFFTHDKALFIDRLERLVALRGKAVVDGWKTQIEAGQMREVVAQLLSAHYDPGYENSTGNNFVHYAQAPIITPASHAQADMQALAEHMLATPI